MSVKRRIPKTRREIDPVWWARLNDAPLPEGANEWQIFICSDFREGGRLAAAWVEHREEVLARWTELHPGSRPSCWWAYDAPRLRLGTFPGCHYDGELPEPRQRLGGKGTPCYEVLRDKPQVSLGFPVSWVDDWMIEYYNGRMKNIHGNPIGTEYHEGNFKAENFDPLDPPRFESQATYLKRHDLMVRGEASLLKDVDFAPEILPRGFWPQ